MCEQKGSGTSSCIAFVVKFIIHFTFCAKFARGIQTLVISVCGMHRAPTNIHFAVSCPAAYGFTCLSTINNTENLVKGVMRGCVGNSTGSASKYIDICSHEQKWSFH